MTRPTSGLTAGAPQRLQRRRLSVVALVSGATLGLTSACGRSDTRGDAAPATAAGAAASETAAAAGAIAPTMVFSAAQVQHGGVRWAIASAINAPSTVELPGQLVPNADHSVQLGAPAQGRVIAVHVSIGERVVAGQALVTLQSADASAARADYDKAVSSLASARAQASFARLERERAERLLAIKAASRTEAERAQTEDIVAQGALQQAEAELTRARVIRAQLGATDASGAMVLRSPMRGIVLSRDATAGTVADAGARLVSITDPALLWLEVAATDRMVGAIRPGTRARFSVPAFPSDTFEARVQSVGAALDSASRTVPIRAAVRNTDGRLRPAMFATVWIDGGAARSVINLPTDAVQLLDNRAVVFLARPDGKGGATFERRDVVVGTPRGTQTPVLSGLAAGDRVVIAGAFAIKSEFARPQMAKE